MNINVLEDIARVPREVQLAAYREIKECRMDRDMAIAYLRTLKNRSPGEAQLAINDSTMAIMGERKGRENVLKHVRKINREIEHLLEYVNSGIPLGPETAAEVRALAERLNSLCVRMQTEEAGGPEDVTDRA
jgi:hypothetical protein